MRVNERALLTITAAINCYKDRPYDFSCPKYLKDEITFSHWALDEILNLIWDHPSIMASEIIESFELNCRLSAIESATPDQRKIFTIAAKTASIILKDIWEVEK